MADDWKPDGARELPADDWKPEGARALEAAAAPHAPAPAQPKTLGRRMEEFAAPVIGAMSPLHVLTHLGDTTPTTPEELGSEARAALNGVTLGHAPQILGWLDPKNAGEFQKDYAQASKDNRVAEMAGAMALPIPGTGALKALKGAGGVAARVLANGAIGSGLGLATGGTDASPTQRALTGFGLGTLGGSIAEGLSGLGAKATDKIRGAWADQAQAENKFAQKGVASTRGALGGQSAAVFNDIAKAQDVLSRPEVYGAERVARAQAYLNSPDVHDVMRLAADNMLEAGPERLKQQLQTARSAYDAAKAAATPEAIEAATSSKMEHPIREQILPRLAHIANRTLPLKIAEAIGGGPETGMAAAAAMGHPGTTLSNMMKSPAVRKLIWGPAQWLAPRAESALSASLPAAVEQAEPMLGPLVPQFADDDAASRQKAQALALRSPREKLQ